MEMTTNSFVASFVDPMTGEKEVNTTCFIAEVELRRGWTLVNDVLTETVCSILYRVGFLREGKKVIYTTPSGPFLKLDMDTVSAFNKDYLVAKCVKAFESHVETVPVDLLTSDKYSILSTEVSRPFLEGQD